MKKNNMTCQLCSSKYTYCPTCREFSKLPTWMNMFDNENCKNIYFACSDYFFSKDLGKAKAILDKCDLSNRDNFNAQTKAILDEILGATIVAEPEVEAVVETPVELSESTTVDALDEFVEEIENEDTTTKASKKKRGNKKSEN